MYIYIYITYIYIHICEVKRPIKMRATVRSCSTVCSSNQLRALMRSSVCVCHYSYTYMRDTTNNNICFRAK